MRVRDAIWKGMLRSYAIWLAVVALVFLGLDLLPDDFPRLFWIPIAIMVIAIPYSLVVAWSACPRCRFSLDSVGWRLRTASQQRRIHHCPGCGLDLDTDLSAVSLDEARIQRTDIRWPFLVGFGTMMVPGVLLLTNQDPEPAGAVPALTLLGLLGGACAAYTFHRSARTRRLSSVLLEPACGFACALVFHSALGLLYHGLKLYAALLLALALAVLVAWAGPRVFDQGA